MILTIAERKERETARRKAAAQSVRVALVEIARRLNGRFVLYGSVAKGAMKHDSDIDLLLDFPDETETEAWQTAEIVCHAHGLPLDIMPVGWVDPRFVERIAEHGVELS